MPLESSDDSRSVTFGPFVFVPGEGELRRSGMVVPLQRQPAMVLEYLLDHPGRIVPRDELIRHVWRDHHVKFDQSLNYCIRQIRRALEERAESPVYLQTIPRRGYRWIAPLHRTQPGQLGGPADALAPSHRPIASRRRWLEAAMGLAVLVALAARLTVPVDPPRAALEDASSPGQLAQAFHALHVLSHAVFEPDRNLDAAGAVRTLWTIAAARIGVIGQ